MTKERKILLNYLLK
jgi:ribosomal protein L21E